VSRRRAFVTGGTRGIGLAIARRLAREGFSVTACGATDESVTACRAAVGDLDVTPVRADVRDEVALRGAIERAGATEGLACLVCSAGQPVLGSALEISLDEWDRCLDVNLKGALIAVQAALPAMKARGEGVIVLVASIWAVTTGRERAAYVTAKTALTGLARSIAVDHAAGGVRANCVAPGYVDTALLRASLAREHDDVEAALERIRRAHPLGRLVTPEEVAGAVAFLASADARSITGQTLVVDGGASVRFALPGT